MRTIELHSETTEAFFSRAKAVAAQLDKDQFANSEAHLSFDGLDHLLGVLTAKRWHLLRALRQKGASSIRALAFTLKRDYKPVHGDVMALIAAGLVERDQAGQVSVPWSEISARFDLAA
jgi:predicted transcriptional regulator